MKNSTGCIDAAVNAVYYNKIQEKPEGEERKRYVEELRAEYRQSIDVYRLASELVVDAVVPSSELRAEIDKRFSRTRAVPTTRVKKHIVPPM